MTQASPGIRPILKVIFLILASASLLSGQSDKIKHPDKPGEKITSGNEAEQKRIQRLLLVRQFVDRATEFKDQLKAVRTLAGIADASWKFDERFARDLFAKALDLSSGNSDAFPESHKYDGDTWPRMRLDLISMIAEHDASWAKHLLEKEYESSNPKNNNAKPGMTSIGIAFSALDNDEKSAIDFAWLGFQEGSSDAFVNFLLWLRKKDATSSDRLFLQSLNTLQSQPNPNGFDIESLGAYVFTSSFLLKNPDIPNLLILSEIENEPVVVINVARPEVSQELIHSYIDAATEILSRPVTEQVQQKRYFIYGTQILPLAERIAPSAAQQLSVALQRLKDELGESINNVSVLSFPDDYRFNRTIEDIEKIEDQNTRDIWYQRLAETACNKNDLKQAKSINEKIINTTISSAVATLIDFDESAQAIDQGNLGSAEQIAARMPDGLASAMLWIDIADRRVAMGARTKAAEAVNNGLAIAEKLSHPGAAYLILTAAGILAHFDTVLAENTLARAIKRFNSEAPNNFAFDWEISAVDKYTNIHMKLKLSRMSFGFAQALQPLMAINREATLQTVLSLEDESMLGSAMVALTPSVLKP
ncbi:MAG TPA: hypothetical protein VFC63_06975 [Blastocatellia bacterium]|nr:hypothetical protein [Blastocatellia bacterium]